MKHRSTVFVLVLFKIQRAFTCWWQHSSNGLMETEQLKDTKDCVVKVRQTEF